MSDEDLSVECGKHGTTSTFVCEHLPAGKHQGFNVGYDPEHLDAPYPNAWCDQCDAVLEHEGEWSDRACRHQSGGGATARSASATGGRARRP